MRSKLEVKRFRVKKGRREKLASSEILQIVGSEKVLDGCNPNKNCPKTDFTVKYEQTNSILLNRWFPA